MPSARRPASPKWMPTSPQRQPIGRPFSGIPISRRNTGRQQRVPAESGAQCQAQGGRPARSGCLRVPSANRSDGLFLGFQYPVEMPGVNNVYLLKAALNAKRKAAGQPEVDAYEFLALIKQKMKLMQMSESFLSRGVNEGFSGGEKKRNEVLQMLVLEPKLAILDETDSGLDIDALKVVSAGVNSLRDPKRAVVLVTHYQRLLDYIVPDQVHVLSGGRIMKSGDRPPAQELQRRGYDWVLESQVA